MGAGVALIDFSRNGRAAYATNRDAGALAIIDPVLARSGSPPCPLTRARKAWRPARMAAWVYVANRNANNVSVVDTGPIG